MASQRPHSVLEQLEGFFDVSFSNLPPERQFPVAEHYTAARWDSLTRVERMAEAIFLDEGLSASEGVETEWQETCARRESLTAERLRWLSAKTSNIAELEKRQERLAALDLELSELEHRLARGDFVGQHIWPESSSETVNADSRATDGIANDHPCRVFQMMKGLDASEISIAFVGERTENGLTGNSQLEIKARGETRRASLAEMQLVDHRSGALNKQAAILIGISRGEAPKQSTKNSKSVSRIRELFQKRLGVRADPFEPHRKGIGWEARFKVIDLRGAADRRAEKEAERRTISLECVAEDQLAAPDRSGQLRTTDTDDADRWLQENDPDYQS